MLPWPCDCGSPQGPSRTLSFFFLFSLLLFWEYVLVFLLFLKSCWKHCIFSSCSQTSEPRRSLSRPFLREPRPPERSPHSPALWTGGHPLPCPPARLPSTLALTSLQVVCTVFLGPTSSLFCTIILHCSKSVLLAFVQHVRASGAEKRSPLFFKILANWRNILNHLRNTTSLKCLWTVFWYQLCVGIPKLKLF